MLNVLLVLTYSLYTTHYIDVKQPAHQKVEIKGQIEVYLHY